MLSWNGDLWVGKDDGLYKIVSDSLSAWPTTRRCAGLHPGAESDRAAKRRDNFRLMVEHQNDLWFTLGQGLMKLTTGNVLTSVAPELGLGYRPATGPSTRRPVRAVNTLWVAAEAQHRRHAPTDTDISACSYILAYFEGKWHPIATLTRPGDMIRSLVVDGGIYSMMPRLWYGAGLNVGLHQHADHHAKTLAVG